MGGRAHTGNASKFFQAVKLRGRARRNFCPVAVANRVGKEPRKFLSKNWYTQGFDKAGQLFRVNDRITGGSAEPTVV